MFYPERQLHLRRFPSMEEVDGRERVHQELELAEVWRITWHQ
jgi:hypothetical protein